MSPKTNQEAYAAIYISLPWSRKVLSIPESDRLAALGFYAATLALCQSYRTDGHVPTEQLAAVIACPEPDRKRLTDALIAVHLFDVADDGIQVHDYLDHNNSRAEIEAARAAMSEGGRKGGRAAGKYRPKVPLKPPPEGSTEIDEIGEELGALPSRAVAGRTHDPEPCGWCKGSGTADGDTCSVCGGSGRK
jgi:hypothetical protein